MKASIGMTIRWPLLEYDITTIPPGNSTNAPIRNEWQKASINDYVQLQKRKVWERKGYRGISRSHASIPEGRTLHRRLADLGIGSGEVHPSYPRRVLHRLTSDGSNCDPSLFVLGVRTMPKGSVHPEPCSSGLSMIAVSGEPTALGDEDEDDTAIGGDCDSVDGELGRFEVLLRGERRCCTIRESRDPAIVPDALVSRDVRGVGGGTSSHSSPLEDSASSSSSSSSPFFDAGNTRSIGTPWPSFLRSRSILLLRVQEMVNEGLVDWSSESESGDEGARVYRFDVLFEDDSAQ